MANTDGIIAEIGMSGDHFHRESKNISASIDQVDKKVKSLDSSINKLSKGGRGAMGQAGNVAMQIQDIAVSLQGGMNGLQVMGQQGSQLLSIFGPKGMLVGGFVAIGAAIGTAFYRGEEKFKNIKIEAKELNVELAKLAKFGHGGELSSGLSKASEQFKNIKKEIEDSKGVFSSIFSLTPQWVKEREMRGSLNDVENGRRKIAQQTIKDSKAELDILRRIASGRKDEAASMKRTQEHQQEIDKISSNPTLTEGEKVRLKELETLKEIARTESTAREQNAKEQGDIDDEKMRRQREHDDSQKRDFESFQDLKDKRQRDHDDQQKKDFLEFEKERIESENRVNDAHEENRAFNADMDARFARERADQAEKDEEAAKRRNEDANAQSDKVKVIEAEIALGDKKSSQIERELKFTKYITDARKNNNEALAKGLEKERDLLKVQEAIDEQLKSPEQNKKERDEEKERKKAARIVASRARRMAQAAGGAGFGGFVDKKGRAVGVPNIQPNAPAAGAAGAAGGAAGAAGGNQMKVDTLVVKTLKHG